MILPVPKKGNMAKNSLRMQYKHMNSIDTNIINSSEKESLLSFVIPIFNEEGNIKKLYEELVRVLERGLIWEIIFVDDGSSDRSWDTISEIYKHDKRVRGLRLSRNFGHQYAIFAGLSAAQGSAVITMDADLQHPPSLIPKLLQEWHLGSKIVHTVRKDNENVSWGKKVTSKLFYKIFSILSGVDLSAGMADYRLLDRQVVNELVRFKEGALFLRGLVEWLGYKSSKVEFNCGDRFSGESKYSVRKMFKFAWTGITSFSLVPLRVGILLGLFTSLFAFFRLGQALYVKFVTGDVVPGWTSTTVVITFLFGVLFILIGIVGEYIGRILMQVQDRPRFIISERIESQELLSKKMMASTSSSDVFSFSGKDDVTNKYDTEHYD